MPSEQEMAYHYTFLSRYYLDQVVADIRNGAATGYTMTDQDVAELRKDNPVGFEEARKALAALLKVPYQPARYASYEGDRGGGYIVEGNPPDAQVVQYLRPRNPPQVNPDTGVPASVDLSVGIANAYLNGNVLLPTTMFYKLDQQFDDYASLWEKAFSTLMAPYDAGLTPHNAFTPIVDESWQVVGHYGELQGGPGCRLLVPAGTKQKMDDFILGGATINDFLEKKVPMRAWPRGPIPDGWESGDFGVSDFTYGVRALHNGEVHHVEVVGNREGKDTDTWQLADLVLVGKALLELGKLGFVLVKSLGVRAASTETGLRILRAMSTAAGRDASSQLDEILNNEARELVADVTKNAAKKAGRDVSAQEMEQLVRAKWNQNLWMKSLRNAGSVSGDAKRKAVEEALKDMEKYYGKSALVVPEGAGLGGTLFEGGAGWAFRRSGGELVLAIERQLLEDADDFYDEVVHDIAFDILRDPNGMPGFRLNENVRFSALSLLEAFIKQGERAISDFRGAVYGQGA